MDWSSDDSQLFFLLSFFYIILIILFRLIYCIQKYRFNGNQNEMGLEAVQLFITDDCEETIYKFLKIQTTY